MISRIHQAPLTLIHVDAYRLLEGGNAAVYLDDLDLDTAREDAPQEPRPVSEEVDLIEPILQRAGEPFALVGHSYGGAVALLAALRRPSRVNALALYEPTLFGLIEATSEKPNAVDGIRDSVAQAGTALGLGDRATAAKIFIDYWMGEGAYIAKPEAQRIAIESIRHIVKKHRGDISVSSELGKGTKFRVVLPIRQTAA